MNTDKEMTEAEKMFNDKAAYNKWMLELTEAKKAFIIDMMEEYKKL